MRVRGRCWFALYRLCKRDGRRKFYTGQVITPSEDTTCRMIKTGKERLAVGAEVNVSLPRRVSIADTTKFAKGHITTCPTFWANGHSFTIYHSSRPNRLRNRGLVFIQVDGMTSRKLILRNTRDELGVCYLGATLTAGGALTIAGHAHGDGVEHVFGPGNREYE